MKNLVKNLFRSLLNTTTGYKIAQHIVWEKWAYDSVEACKIISPNNVVISGLFKGMKYPILQSAGSALFPKILGNYEDELSKPITHLLRHQYSEIIDVGCAEGYFAVGLALKQKTAKVYAFDTDTKALQLCEALAKENNVDSQFIYNGTCTAKDLANFRFTGRGLIISDCEGYEMRLFDKNSLHNLANCDLIIEIHDMYEGVSKEYFIELFKSSHDITVVQSKYKFMKDYPELNNLPVAYKNDALLIERGSRMEWLVIESKM